MTSAVLLPVILCGGSGTRLWPLSRETYPKQFLSLTGGQSMLQQAATRLHGLSGTIPQAPAPVLVCNEEHRFVLASQLKDAGVDQPSILLEPEGRNTAPALTLAALQATAGGDDPILLAMPADHAMADLPAFCRAVEVAYAAALEGSVVTFGISPCAPETGYGYIRCGAARAQGVHAVEGFAEKPDLDLARRYLESGSYLWNSGLFMLRASLWLQVLERFRPDIFGACTLAMRSARHDLDFIRPDAAAFKACPSDSIDYAVMEKLPARPEWGIPVQVVPLQAGWSDVGTWDAVWKVSDRTPEGNALVGQTVQHRCSNSLLFSSGRPVVGIGLENLVVVETPDAVLVVDMRHTQEVKKVVAQLAEDGCASVHAHRKVHRPWGWYDCIDGGERFQVKRIVVNPGASLSLQMHNHRAEHWVVVKGVAEVTHGNRKFLLQENESTYIPLGHEHRLRNPGEILLEIIEIQSGSYLGEDDIVRLDDVYGRVAQGG